MSNTQERHPEFVADQREFFDELVTEDWATFSNEDWDRSRRYEVRQLLSRLKPRSVLDVGCGCGFHDVEIASNSGVEHVLGIDYSARSIEAAEREYPHPNVERRVDDIFKLDEGEYDLVVSFQVIEHLTDPLAFLRACAARTRPGGSILIATPNRDRCHNRWLKLRGREPQLIDPQHFQEFNRGELRDLGREAGLSPTAEFAYGLSVYLPRLGWQIVPKRLGLYAGSFLPGLADVLCQVYEVPDPELGAATSNPVYASVAESYGGEEDRSEAPRLKSELLDRYVDAKSVVLDVGCANGTHLMDVATRCREAVGLDPSDAMLAECERRLAAAGVDNANLVEGRAEALPFEANTFDVLYCYSSTLFLVPDGDRALSEFARVLRPGGVALIDAAGRWNLSQRHWSRWWSEQGHAGFTVFTLRGLRQQLAELGLVPLETHALGAVDQLKYVRILNRLRSLEAISVARSGRSIDYRVSNLPLLDRVANRWFIAAEKA